jgi:hypothetical protein
MEERTMGLKEIVKPKIVLPIFIGIIAGFVFIFVREIDAIPLLPFAFVILCFGFIFYGVKNISKVNNKIKPKVIVPLFLGIFGVIYAFTLLNKGEFEDSPGVFVLMCAICIGLLFFGMFNIKQIRQKIDHGIAVPLFYCISGIVLTIILEFDGELTKRQRGIVIMVFIFIAAISISTIMIIRKMRILHRARRNCV